MREPASGNGLMRKFLLTAVFIAGLHLLSQAQSSYSYTDLNAEPSGAWTEGYNSPSVIARISFIVPMFVVEFAPVQSFVFSTGIRLWPTFWEQNAEGQSIYNPSLNPRMTLEPRYFLTQSYRRSSGRRTDYYSGWYVGLPFMMTFPELDYYMGMVFGFQCTFGKRWYWNASLGPGVSFQEGTFKMVTMGTAAFGVILN